MKILRLTPHYYFESGSWPSEFDPLGGMQTQITYLSEKLAEKGINQVIITSGYPRATQINQKNLKVITVSNYLFKIKSRIDGLVGFNLFWLLGTVKWIFRNRKKMNKFDLIHHHYSGVYAPIVASLIINKLFKIEQVITIHCSRNFTFIPPNLCSRLLNNIIKKMELKTIYHAKKIIVLTEKQKGNYISIGIDTDKIEVIGDAIPEYHLTIQKPIKDKWAEVLKSDKKKIAFVGRISFEKGCECLIEIAQRLNRKDVVFIVVGDGPQKDEFINKVRLAQLSELFIITGFLSRIKIPYILQNIDILLIPSRHEEFGGVVLEGVAAGKPIITSGVGGISKVLGDDYNGIVGDNIEKYCEIINAYLNKELVPNYNRTSIIRKYNFDISIMKLCQIYVN